MAPLPIERRAGDWNGRATKLLHWVSVRRSELSRERRVATLTERGVYIFQQRFTHALTRVGVPLSRFEQVSKHILREAELEYDWISELAAEGADDKAIAQLVRDFHTILDADNNREMLRQEGGESRLRRTIHAAIRESRGQ